MASIFKGRDYTTLREEIITFLRQRLPQDWDYTNMSDPVVIFAESLARMGDQLHYTIDELRRECDVSTATRASSIYSYAMREGYKMMLPRGAFGTISINKATASDYSDEKEIEGIDFNKDVYGEFNKFDEIVIGTSGYSLYVMDAVDRAKIQLKPEDDKSYIANNTDSIINYANYVENIYSRTMHVNVVLGKKSEFNFTYNDINNDSTVTLPNSVIDRYLLRLTVHSSENETSLPVEWTYVDDVIASGFYGRIYTLTPKFIGGAVILCIEFPSNFRDLFKPGDTFKFEYIKIDDISIEDDDNHTVAKTLKLSKYITDRDGNQLSDKEQKLYKVSIGSGISGYTEYEDPMITRENYKKFVQDYSALLTKNDYESYLKVATPYSCKVFDHSDNYKVDVLPENTWLIPRVIYVLTDAKYDSREVIWSDLKQRSGRSDCIVMFPYGVDPYTIVVKAECYLLGTPVSDIATKIQNDLIKYYSGHLGEVIPENSMIDYIVHKASDKVIRMSNVIVRDSTYHNKGDVYKNDDTFKNVENFDNDEVDTFFRLISDDSASVSKSDYIFMRDHGLIWLMNTDDQESSDDPDQSSTYARKFTVQKYKSAPDEFPKIYLTADNTENSNEVELKTYEQIVGHQLIYSEIDSSSYDTLDVFDAVNGGTDEESTVKLGSRPLNETYIKHHYMVPVLNQVVVLIKAIDKQ